jgi:hypothetical protein
MKVLLSLVQTHWWPGESPTILCSNLLVTLWKSYGLRFKPIGDRHIESPTVLGSNLSGTLSKSYGLRFKPIGDRPSESLYCFRFKFVGDSVKVLLFLLSFGLTWGYCHYPLRLKAKSLVVSSAIGLTLGYCQQLVSWVYSCIPKQIKQNLGTTRRVIRNVRRLGGGQFRHNRASNV